jgi:hypothetical protein
MGLLIVVCRDGSFAAQLDESPELRSIRSGEWQARELAMALEVCQRAAQARGAGRAISIREGAKGVRGRGDCMVRVIRASADRPAPRQMLRTFGS